MIKYVLSIVKRKIFLYIFVVSLLCNLERILKFGIWKMCWGFVVIFWSFCFDIEFLMFIVNVIILVWWVRFVVFVVFEGKVECLFVIINKKLGISGWFFVVWVKLCWIV